MGVTSFFKNIFGSAKEKASELADLSENVIEQAKEAATPILEKAGDAIETAVEQAKEAATPILEKANEYADQAKSKADEYSEKANDLLEDAVAQAKEAATPILDKAENLVNSTIETVKEKTAELTGDSETTKTSE